MARKPRQMKKLEELLEQLDRQMDELRLKREGVELALRALSGDSADKPARVRARRSNVKTAVIDLLRHVRDEGLNAVKAIDLARELRDEKLERGSVSSLLSRLKKEGTVVYDGKLYRLKEYAPGARSEDVSVASVHPLRASGDAP